MLTREILSKNKSKQKGLFLFIGFFFVYECRCTYANSTYMEIGEELTGSPFSVPTLWFEEGPFLLFFATVLLVGSPVSASHLTVSMLGLGLQMCAIAVNFYNS